MNNIIHLQKGILLGKLHGGWKRINGQVNEKKGNKTECSLCMSVWSEDMVSVYPSIQSTEKLSLFYKYTFPMDILHALQLRSLGILPRGASSTVTAAVTLITADGGLGKVLSSVRFICETGKDVVSIQTVFLVLNSDIPCS